MNSGIAAFYYLRVLAALYTKPAESSPVVSVPRATTPLLFALLLTAAATLILGIVPGRVLAKAKAAAAVTFTPTTSKVQAVELPGGQS
jgi:NADH-quinone oxidoreductase subunit N